MHPLIFTLCLAGVLFPPHLNFANPPAHLNTGFAFTQTTANPLDESNNTRLDKIAAAHQKQVKNANQSPFKGMGLMAVGLIAAGLAWFLFRRYMSD